MSEMVERIVRAMRRAKHARCCKGAALDDVVGLPITDGERDLARAAIEAMRAPTEAMIEDEHVQSITYYPETAWKALIDAALKEKPE